MTWNHLSIFFVFRIVAQPRVITKLNKQKVLLPSVHVKLGLLKIFIKALDKKGEAFKYLKQSVPKLSDAN